MDHGFASRTDENVIAACMGSPVHIASHRVNLMSDGRSAPAAGPGVPPADLDLALTGRPTDARLPLALLEAVKLIDTPATEFEAELFDELRTKRLGLSDTVAQQIRRYAQAVKAGQSIGYEETLALARLLGRRPDADMVFREAGRRWARAIADDASGLRRTLIRVLPSILSRPIALGLLRGLIKRHVDGTLVRQGSSILLEVVAPVSADAAPRGGGCLLYEATFRELLFLLVQTEGAIEHVMCRARGDLRCQWRTDWRRR